MHHQPSRSSTTAPARSSSRASQRRAPRGRRRSTRSRPSSSTRRRRSRTRPSGRTPASTRSASCLPPSTPSAATPRRLDHHPAAGAPAAARPGPRAGPVAPVERKIKEIIQSIRVTEAYPGRRRQADGSSPPTSTRTTTATTATASRPRRAATSASTTCPSSRSAQVASWPACRSRRRNYDLVRNAEEQPDGQARRAPRPGRHRAIVAAAQLHPRPARRQTRTRRVLTRRQVQPRRTSRPRKDDRSSSRRRSAPQWKAPHFVWSVRERAHRRSCARGRDDVPPARAGRAEDRHDARLEGAADRREVGRRRRPSCPTTPDPQAYAAQHRRAPTSPGCRACATTRSATARWSPSTTRPARSSPTSAAADYYGDQASQAVPAAVRRARRRLAPARSAFKPFNYVDRHRRPARSPRRRCSWT